ncbi:MAG: adenylyltransferase/cytidyltransferase family protein [Candidatus Marinimicrobia bacterium]|nr:adenylyltransferase/cytidyltransferase family protein [Candidatus Neomarinimicrobiota bacterium]
MDARDKIVKLEELPELLKEHRKAGQKVILCHGVFDLLHPGHIKHIEAAKKNGDILVVTITPDEYVNKGPHRPVFDELYRAETIGALEKVNYVAINKWPSAVHTIELLTPDIYVKGSDYKNPDEDITGEIANENKAIAKVGGRIIYTDEETFSSSKIINENLHLISDEAKKFISGLKNRYSQGEILGTLNSLQDLKVTIVGEAIIDEYIYGDTIGKSSKDPHLVLRQKNIEIHLGGSLAIANQVAEFCGDVTLVTYLGDRESYEELIKEKLNPDIITKFIYKTDSPTIVKKRIIDDYFFHKLIEIYTINDEDLSKKQEKELIEILDAQLDESDAVLVCDYGHGLISENTINSLSKTKTHLAVNVQSNAGNFGYNFISKYPRAELVTVDESELRLENRNKFGDVEDLLENVYEKMDYGQIIVTRGANGSSAFSRETGHIKAPALAGNIVDRMGAGDTFFSLSSLLSARGVPLEIVSFIGNAVGALAVKIVGNKEPITKISLKKTLISLLK